MLNPITDGGGPTGQIIESSERNALTIQKERKIVLIEYGIALSLQAGLYSFLYVVTPGYVVPLLNCAPARIIFLLIFFWQAVAIAAHWYLAPISNLNRAALLIPIVLFIFIPAFLFPLLGPACIGILNALGPIMTGS